MGKVEYGAHEMERNTWVPFIRISEGDKGVEFLGSIAFEDEDDAREFAAKVYAVLSGEQRQLTIHGDA